MSGFTKTKSFAYLILWMVLLSACSTRKQFTRADTHQFLTVQEFRVLDHDKDLCTTNAYQARKDLSLKEKTQAQGVLIEQKKPDIKRNRGYVPGGNEKDKYYTIKGPRLDFRNKHIPDNSDTPLNKVLKQQRKQLVYISLVLALLINIYSIIIILPVLLVINKVLSMILSISLRKIERDRNKGNAEGYADKESYYYEVVDNATLVAFLKLIIVIIGFIVILGIIGTRIVLKKLTTILALMYYLSLFSLVVLLIVEFVLLISMIILSDKYSKKVREEQATQ